MLLKAGSRRVEAGTTPTAAIRCYAAASPAARHVTSVDLELVVHDLGFKVVDTGSWFMPGCGEEGRRLVDVILFLGGRYE